jgi:hypothetical protein
MAGKGIKSERIHYLKTDIGILMCYFSRSKKSLNPKHFRSSVSLMGATIHSGEEEEKLYIREYFTLSRAVRGRVKAEAGAHLRIRAHITGELFLMPGSIVYLYGSVDGDIQNEGGILTIFGSVNGNITTVGGMTRALLTARIRKPEEYSLRLMPPLKSP